MCLTYPHIGNVGTNLDDEESAKPYIEALIVREFSRARFELAFERNRAAISGAHGVPVIWEIDTRALVRHLRDVGALRGILSTDGTPAEQLIAEARALPTMAGQELAGRVTTAGKLMIGRKARLNSPRLWRLSQLRPPPSRENALGQARNLAEGRGFTPPLQPRKEMGHPPVKPRAIASSPTISASSKIFFAFSSIIIAM